MRLSTPSNPNVTVSGVIATQYEGLAAVVPAIVDNADAQAPVGANGIPPVLARLQALNLASTAYNRVHSGTLNADAMALAVEALITASQLTGFNGTSWDRVRADNVGGAGALRVTQRGHGYTNTNVSTNLLVANTSEPAIVSASNVNGAILWNATCLSVPTGGFPIMSLAASAAAPNSTTVGDVLQVARTDAFGSAVWVGSVTLDQPIFIPAGKGVWWTSLFSESAGNRQVVFTLL
jgi:hypothetical protein